MHSGVHLVSNVRLGPTIEVCARVRPRATLRREKNVYARDARDAFIIAVPLSLPPTALVLGKSSQEAEPQPPNRHGS